MRGGQPRPPALHINPVDATRLGVVDGADVHVTTNAGQITVPAEITTDVSTGVVCYPHGWGHKGGWRKAVQHGGANINDIIPNTVEFKERLSGMSYMDGIAVEVVPC